MTIGDSIAIVGIAVPVASIIIVAIKTKLRGNSKSSSVILERSEHDRICALIQNGVQEKFKYISDQLNNISNDVKFLTRAKVGGSRDVKENN